MAGLRFQATRGPPEWFKKGRRDGAPRADGHEPAEVYLCDKRNGESKIKPALDRLLS